MRAVILVLRIWFIILLSLGAIGYHYTFGAEKRRIYSVCERYYGEEWDTVSPQGNSYGAICCNGKETKWTPPLQSQRWH